MNDFFLNFRIITKPAEEGIYTAVEFRNVYLAVQLNEGYRYSHNLIRELPQVIYIENFSVERIVFVEGRGSAHLNLLEKSYLGAGRSE